MFSCPANPQTVLERSHFFCNFCNLFYYTAIRVKCSTCWRQPWWLLLEWMTLGKLIFSFSFLFNRRESYFCYYLYSFCLLICLRASANSSTSRSVILCYPFIYHFRICWKNHFSFCIPFEHLNQLSFVYSIIFLICCKKWTISSFVMSVLRFVERSRFHFYLFLFLGTVERS